jgi:hypothetical protein
MDATKMPLASLAAPKITRAAIANPKHAPYDKRAEEANARRWNSVTLGQNMWVQVKSVAFTEERCQFWVCINLASRNANNKRQSGILMGIEYLFPFTSRIDDLNLTQSIGDRQCRPLTPTGKIPISAEPIQ